MAASVYIDGGAGTTGLEIADRLSGRADFTLLTLPDDLRKDDAARREMLNSSDFVILCLPDEAARQAVDMVTSTHTRIIDASSAHRVATGWTYAFAELTPTRRTEIANASRVSNPGCYPTGFLGLIAPLVAAGLIPGDFPYSVNAVSGYSGGGKALIERFTEESALGFRAYGLTLDHKHVPEMQRHAGLVHAPLFAPSVVRAYRGMVVEVPVPLGVVAPSLDAAAITAALADHFDGEPLVRVTSGAGIRELLLREHDAAHDGLDLHVAADPTGRQLRLIATLDNLGKGAAGAAVQNLNIMAGLPELAGLRLPWGRF